MKPIKQNGFTLVELAIVMTIVGLIIGGVLKGQELIAHARTRAVIKQINSYTSAVTGFRDRYSYLPGDFPFATTRLANCDPAYCVNGNGDGVIGIPSYIYEQADQSRAYEHQQFWQHLAVADFAGGIETHTTLMGFGHSHPVAAYGGGFTAIYGLPGNGPASANGLWLRLHYSLDVANPESSARVSPHWAGIVDRKMDDGVPGSGIVRAFQEYNPAAGTENNCEYAYDENSNTEHCLVTFRIAN